MDCKLCNRENTKYSYILCGNCVCNVCAVPVDESQEGYDEQNCYVLAIGTKKRKIGNDTTNQQLKDILKVKYMKTHMKLVREEKILTLTENRRKK